MIFENRKTNERMDKLEVERANEELKKIDPNRTAQLMTAYLNKKPEKEDDRDR